MSETNNDDLALVLVSTALANKIEAYNEFMFLFAKARAGVAEIKSAAHHDSKVSEIVSTIASIFDPIFHCAASAKADAQTRLDVILAANPHVVEHVGPLEALARPQAFSAKEDNNMSIAH